MIARAARHFCGLATRRPLVVSRQVTRTIATAAKQPAGNLDSHQHKGTEDDRLSERARARSFCATGDKRTLYSLTRGRFVQNEAAEMKSRSVEYNVFELGKLAAAAVHSDSCTRTDPFTEGMHSKALLLTMNDGKQVVAKLPYPVAGQPHFTTASEVATMDLMRTTLGTPVPKVYAWCSCAASTPVGAEYIIMAKARGVLLSSVWKNLDIRQKGRIARSIGELQATWTSATFEGYGSIYYADDLAEEARLPMHHFSDVSASTPAFAVGPITGRTWNDDGRRFVEFKRGPWTTTQEYLAAIGHREMACVQNLAKLPPSQLTLCGPGTYHPTREKKCRAIKFYLQLLEHLLPRDPDLQKASAWHGDLHLDNIFVNPDDPTIVTDIIDWQSTEVTPLFLQARQPYILDYDGPQTEGLERPELPPNFEELSPKERAAARRVYFAQCLCDIYKIWTRSCNTKAWKSFEFQKTPACDLLLLVRNMLVDGEAVYAAYVLDYLEEHPEVAKQAGLAIAPDLEADIEADAQAAEYGMQLMADMKDAMGDLFPDHGLVRLEKYDSTKLALEHCKKQVIDELARTDADRAAWERLWPWDN